MCTRHTSRPDACERPYGLRLTSHPIPRAGSASEQKRGRSVRAFGKDRARETQAPARSILAAVPTPLGPPVGCHPTPSDGIAHANLRTESRVGKGLILIKKFWSRRIWFSGFGDIRRLRAGLRLRLRLRGQRSGDSADPVQRGCAAPPWSEDGLDGSRSMLDRTTNV